MYCTIYCLTTVLSVLLIRLPPITTRTDTLLPYTTLFRSVHHRLRPARFDCRTWRLMAPAAPRRPGPRTRSSAFRAQGDSGGSRAHGRSEEHTSELQSLIRTSSALFCLKKNRKRTNLNSSHQCATRQTTSTQKKHNRY